MAASTVLETAHSFMAGYNAWTIESIMALRAPNCIQYILPASLDQPSFNNEQYATYFASIMPAFRGWHITIHDTIHDEPARKIAMHCTSTGETDIGPYNNEYMIVLHMTGDGRKVEKVLEYVDSGYSKNYMSRLREHVAKQAKAAI